MTSTQSLDTEQRILEQRREKSIVVGSCYGDVPPWENKIEWQKREKRGQLKREKGGERERKGIGKMEERTGKKWEDMEA